MVDAEVVGQIRELHRGGWGSKRIARELEVARNTVRRYLRLRTDEAMIQVRPRARQLDAAARADALRLFEGPAEHNAVVVTQLLRERGVAATERVVQKILAPRRRELRALQLATVRYETAPGHQMQIDFGQKRVRIGEHTVVVHLLVAVLSYSRRLFVKAFLAERGDDWREGIAAAFRHFGGVPRTVLGDNARALVVLHDRRVQTVFFHPAYVAFCRDWDVVPRACGPYRARTKGKTESGVKYVKRNALAGRTFPSFTALEAHLAHWIREVDQRVHGTTFEAPAVRFERDERARLRPLPRHALAVRERRLRRRVALDAMVDVDTVRYSVPHRLVRAHVEVHVGDHVVSIYHGTQLIATHARRQDPHARVIEAAHFDGLWRRPRTEAAEPTVTPIGSPLEALGRSLHDYAAVITEAGV
jgi:transposase